MLPRHHRYDYSPITVRQDYNWPGEIADYCCTLEPGIIPGSC
jgi:hypothetical protein